MKKMAKVMVLVLALCLVVPTICSAVTIVAATVVKAGQNVSGGYVMITDTATHRAIPTNTWFQFPSVRPMGSWLRRRLP